MHTSTFFIIKKAHFTTSHATVWLRAIWKVFGFLAVLLSLLLLNTSVHGQTHSGYLKESFEGGFPPTDWQVRNALGTNQWVKSTAKAHTGSASAFINYQNTSAEDWLILPHFSVEKTTDSIIFWMHLQYQGYTPDRLQVMVSTTDDALTSFTTTLLDLQEGVNYPPNATTWYRYKVSLEAYKDQQIYLAFKHTNNNGDGLYIDDVELGTPPAADVAVVSIDAPQYATSAGATPKVTVKNEGSAMQSFTLQLIATDGYSSSVPVVDLAPQATQQVSLSTWTPQPGTYTLTATAILPTDEVTDNNTIIKSVSAYKDFPNQGWITKTALPSPRWANGVASFSNPTENEAALFAISGSNASFAFTPLNERFDAVANTYTTMAPIPVARMHVAAHTIGGKIYVAGGYTSGFSPTNRLDIYDIATNTWTTGANMLTAVGDCASAVLGDSLLYIVGGYNGTSDVNLVQIYNINTNTWLSGTAKAGTAAAGLRGGIAAGKIVIAGGYNQSTRSLAEAWLGTINPDDPSQITWTALPALPGGPSSRLGAGAGVFLNRIFFTSGDPTGEGTQALATTFAYNVMTQEWEVGPSKPTGVSNIVDFTPIVLNNHIYMAVAGGYSGSAVVSANEWLDLGPVLSTTITQTNVSCNGGNNGSATVEPTGGTAPYTYAWNTTPAQTTATATNLPAGTYTVIITDASGYALEKTVTITESDAISASISSQTNVSCFGGSNGRATVQASGGMGILTYAWAPSGGTQATATGLVAGTYSVTITDVNGCQETETVTITQPTAPVSGYIVVTNVSCNGGSNGSINLTPTGGTAPYTYNWGGGITTEDRTGLAAGNYTVVITDNNGCTGGTIQATVMVVDNQAPVINTITSPIVLLWSPNHKYQRVNAAQFITSVTDNCGSIAAGNVVITKVTSDEPDNAPGNADGNTTQDIKIANTCKTVDLRSERIEGGNGRVYTIYLQVRDASGNIGTATAKAIAAPSQSGKTAVDNGVAYSVLSSCGSTSVLTMNMVAQQVVEEEQDLQVRALPNPSTTYFTLQIQSSSDKAVQLRVVDEVGRIVEGKNGIASTSTYRIGQSYRPGVYFAQVMQGGKMVTLKLIKQAY